MPTQAHAALEVTLAQARAQPVRVLHVLGRMERGGAELRTLEIMRRLDPQQFMLEFCVLSGQAGSLDGEVVRLGGRVHHLPISTLTFPARFSRLLRNGQYDIVHSHVHLTSGLILWIAARSGTRGRIAHFRSTHDGRSTSITRAAWQRVKRHLIHRYATHTVAVCRGAMESVWSAAWRSDPRCRVLYNGLDAGRVACARDRDAIRAELGVSSTGPVFLHLGNVTAAKNHPRVLDIFASIVGRAPESRLILAGRGTNDPNGDIARRSGALGIRSQIVTVGMQDDVASLLRAADVLLLPSRWEGLPGVVLEACAAGVPVLASDLPGVREIASHLQLVRVLPLSASDDEWAASALTLPEAAGRLQLRAIASDAFRASVFNIDRAVEAHCALWRDAARNYR
jgi:glycosyltransferase involved in cell wall biosynthesis